LEQQEHYQGLIHTCSLYSTRRIDSPDCIAVNLSGSAAGIAISDGNGENIIVSFCLK
jgi:hypothetical protein